MADHNPKREEKINSPDSASLDNRDRKQAQFVNVDMTSRCAGELEIVRGSNERLDAKMLDVPNHRTGSTALKGLLATVIPLVVAIHTASDCLAAETSPDLSVNFARDVYPILRRSCFECHGAETQSGDLRLDTREGALGNEAAIVPGEPGFSELVRRISLPADNLDVMPATGDPLSKKEIKIIRTWIEQGAHWPEEFQARKHWAYVKPVRPPIPSVEDRHWPRNAIDAFVLARLEREGLAPSPAAEPAALARRLYLDITGLPPSPSELDAFLEDPSEAAYERLVDDLLSRPQFGERWARPWLDLARYADSHGFQRDNLRDIWAFRDWVIDAINADMPFDQFTIEQLAGDLLPNATESQKIATGFHRCTTVNVEAGSLPEETRTNQVIDRVNTTATVWLGSTLKCAQCHDHKYDPFSQKEYYEFLAFFNNTAIEAERRDPKIPASIKFLPRSMTLTRPQRAKEHTQAQSRLAKLRRQIKERRRELNKSLENWIAERFRSPDTPSNPPKKLATLLKMPPDQWDKKQRKTVMDYRADRDAATKSMRKKARNMRKDVQSTAPLTTLVMNERTEPRQTHIFERGNYRSPGQVVTPSTPDVLHALPQEGRQPPNRLAFARWIASEENPLMARVTVNRWWALIFGHGIVTTPGDFGIRGAAPTHPELLDWLALEFAESGWSRKHIVKTIVTSATYRQSSRITPELWKRDDRNLLYARGPRYRMSAEMIRDNALAIAGLLDLQQEGPPIRPYQPEGFWKKIGGDKVDYVVSPGSQRHRRGIYVVLKRGAPYPSFINFDATPRLVCTVKRARSNTPLQALTLLNDPVYVEAAMALARRVLTERPNASTPERIRYAFRLCTARYPDQMELETLRELYDQQLRDGNLHKSQTKSLVSEFDVPHGVSKATFAAWYAIATTLLNLDETITK